MNKTGDEKLDKLFAIARSAKPDTEPVEYGFETRLMARIALEQQETASALAWIWRLVPVFSMIALLLVLYSLFSAPPPAPDFESALVGRWEESMLVNFLVGSGGG